MLNFLQYEIEQRYVCFKDDEPTAAFLDKSDAFLYSQYYPLYGLEEVDCLIPPPDKFEDMEEKHDSRMVRILLRKKPTECDPRTQVEIWYSDSLAKAAVYAYIHHTCKFGGSANDFEMELTEIEFFEFANDNYKPNLKKVRTSPLITEVLSHVNETNYDLVVSFLEFCFYTKSYDMERLQERERASFTYNGNYVESEDEQLEIVNRIRHGFISFEIFNDYGLTAYDYFKKWIHNAKDKREKKKGLVMLFLVLGYELYFPTFVYELIINDEVPPLP